MTRRKLCINDLEEKVLEEKKKVRLDSICIVLRTFHVLVCIHREDILYCTCVCVYVCACMRVCVCVCVFVCVCVCVCVCDTVLW